MTVTSTHLRHQDGSWFFLDLIPILLFVPKCWKGKKSESSMTSYSTFASANYLIGSPFWLSLTKNFEIYLTSFKRKNWSWQQSLIKVILLCVQLSAFLWWFKAIHLINSRWIGANWLISFVQWSRFFSYSVTDATPREEKQQQTMTGYGQWPSIMCTG